MVLSSSSPTPSRVRRLASFSCVERSAESIRAATGASRCEACSLLQEVQAAMERLPFKQRIALIQRQYHDLS